MPSHSATRPSENVSASVSVRVGCHASERTRIEGAATRARWVRVRVGVSGMRRRW
jgi:hypothetical protein